MTSTQVLIKPEFFLLNVFQRCPKYQPAFKILGIYFDENLSFDYHIKQTRNKVFKSIFYLNRAKTVKSRICRQEKKVKRLAIRIFLLVKP